MLDYQNKVALAPMVRVSELPLRTLSLKYGADIVWGPEVVDKGIIATNRVLNDKLGTIDYVSEKDPERIIFRTDPALEKDKVVFQMGSADPINAVEAAKKIAPDVAAIDLNCGCPMHFSVHSGMGSQLLGKPDTLISILEALVNEVGTPQKIAISCKIRVLKTAEETYELVNRIAQTGIQCLTVHCRRIKMRPREPAFYDYLKEIVEICHRNNVACFVNGDIKNREDLKKFREIYNVDGVMIGRPAQKNPSCFGDYRASEWEICHEFINRCIKYDYNGAHSKYNLSNFVSGKDPLYLKFIRTTDKHEMLASLEEVGPDYDYKSQRKQKQLNHNRQNQNQNQNHTDTDTDTHTEKRVHENTDNNTCKTRKIST